MIILHTGKKDLYMLVISEIGLDWALTIWKLGWLKSIATKYLSALVPISFLELNLINT